MARRKRSQNGKPSARVVEAQEAGKTQRTLARWKGLARIFTALCAAIAAPVTASEAAGHVDQFNLFLLVLIGIGAPAAGGKILWARGQKQRLRAEKDELDRENLQLHRRVGELEGQVSELRKQLPQTPAKGLGPK